MNGVDVVDVSAHSEPHEGCLERACECVQQALAAAEKGRDYYSARLAEEGIRQQRRGAVDPSTVGLPAGHPVALAERLLDALNTEEVAEARALLAELVERVGAIRPERGAVDHERLRRENDDLRQVNARLAQAEKDAVAARVAAEDALYDQHPRGAADPSERLREALREVVRRAEGGNARAQWVAEPAREALDA